MSAPPLVCRNCSALISRGYNESRCPFCLCPDWKVLTLKPKKPKKGQRISNSKRPLLMELGQRDDWTCYLCGGEVPFPNAVDLHDPLAPSADHIIPRSAGGRNHVSNLAIAHRGCNNARMSKPLTVKQMGRLRLAQRTAQDLPS